MSYHTTEVVGFPPHSTAQWGFGRRPKSRRGRPSPAFRHPPTMAVTGPLWPRTADGLPTTGDGSSESIDRGSLVDGCGPYVGPLVPAPAFNYGCSLGLSVVASDATTARRVGLRPSRSSVPVRGPAHVRPVPRGTFALPRTMPNYTLQHLRRFETAESGSADTRRKRKSMSGFLPRLKPWVSTLGANL